LPRFSTNFGRFEVAFDRPEFDRTQVLVVELQLVTDRWTDGRYKIKSPATETVPS